MMEILLVLVGGGIGSVSRYLASNWAMQRFGADFPYGTLIVNVVGCFFIGAFMVLTTEKLNVSPYWRLLVAVGFLGGLTTFSSFSYETLRLMQDADFLRAFYNVGLNVVLGFLAAWLGMGVSRLI
ncbi:putative fluoride ion transporter CrcB 2 [Sporomusaceae bacterium FL31]|nr:putative fluoride ion transporter CrcB 2 [Sporomusaceae bacterium FL31]GCE34512.1 putative fluoride ion transporter CrcB 2 [Sporomusaceae bacterium]